MSGCQCGRRLWRLVEKERREGVKKERQQCAGQIEVVWRVHWLLCLMRVRVVVR